MNSHQVRGIIFRLHRDWFFVDIMRVREITRYQQPAVPAGLPGVVTGVMAYRGETVPVLTLRQRFDLPEGGDPTRSRIVMLAMPGRTIGILVDEVADQFTLSVETITPTSPLVPLGIAPYLIGTAQAGDRQMLLVDIDRLLSPDEERTLGAAVQAARTARPMVVVCPSCGARFRVEREHLCQEEPKFRCASCRGLFRIAGASTGSLFR